MQRLSKFQIDLLIDNCKIIKKELKKEIQIELMKTTLGFRTAYMDAQGEGYSPDEWRDTKAKEEVYSLLKETLKII